MTSSVLAPEYFFGELNISLGRPMHKQEENIQMDLQEIVRESLDWLGLEYDGHNWRTLTNSVLNLQAPSKAGNLTEGLWYLASQQAL